ncbi:hypothetical protein [Thermococcus sp. MAR1]|uniref:hypothetical protein n=1 Tax=Thermococcus sp. MAR1 TaxID=1638263 RepID=UPI001438918C|nr:hypothetical protein [Thermococcus sp. MAR1]NJE11230.1 hypothetical protein [Thermococcus sp. MAR1]
MVRLRGAWPLSAPGIALFLRFVAVALLSSVGWVMENYGPAGYFALLLASAFLFGVSSGWKVEVSEKGLTLVYGFGILRVNAGEVLEVKNVGELKLGTLWKDLANSLLVPSFFMLLSFVLFGVKGFLVLPFVAYWLVLYWITLAFPVRTLKERMGRLFLLALLLPWALSAPFAASGMEFQWFGLSLFTSLIGFWFVLSWVSMEYVEVLAENGRFLIGCHDAERVIKALGGIDGA